MTTIKEIAQAWASQKPQAIAQIESIGSEDQAPLFAAGGKLVAEDQAKKAGPLSWVVIDYRKAPAGTLYELDSVGILKKPYRAEEKPQFIVGEKLAPATATASVKAVLEKKLEADDQAEGSKAAEPSKAGAGASSK